MPMCCSIVPNFSSSSFWVRLYVAVINQLGVNFCLEWEPRTISNFIILYVDSQFSPIPVVSNVDNAMFPPVCILTFLSMSLQNQRWVIIMSTAVFFLLRIALAIWSLSLHVNFKIVFNVCEEMCWESYWFYRLLENHFHNINSSNPKPWRVFPSFTFFLDLQSFTVFVG